MDALIERSTAARVAGSIAARNKYLYDLYLVLPGLAVVYVSLNVCKRAYDTGIIFSVGQLASIA